MFIVIILYGKMHEIQERPHSSVDRALPSGGRSPRSSRGGGIENSRHPADFFYIF